jgi:hypothetical protein
MDGIRRGSLDSLNVRYNRISKRVSFEATNTSGASQQLTT